MRMLVASMVGATFMFVGMLCCDAVSFSISTRSTFIFQVSQTLNLGVRFDAHASWKLASYLYEGAGRLNLISSLRGLIALSISYVGVPGVERSSGFVLCFRMLGFSWLQPVSETHQSRLRHMRGQRRPVFEVMEAEVPVAHQLHRGPCHPRMFRGCFEAGPRQAQAS